MLKKLLKDKEREMRLLAKQVMKFNKENFALLQELEGYVSLTNMIYCICKLNLLGFSETQKAEGKVRNLLFVKSLWAKLKTCIKKKPKVVSFMSGVLIQDSHNRAM